MKNNTNKNKIVSILAVFILLSSIFLSINVSSSFVKNNDDGVWYDEFYDDIDIAEKDNVTSDFVNGTIVLNKDALEPSYNYHSTPDNVEGWYFYKKFIPSEENEFFSLISQIIPPKMFPGTAFTNSEMAKMGQRDSDYVKTQSAQSIFSNYTYKPMHHFRIKVDNDVSDIEDIKIFWYSGPYNSNANLEKISMFLWAYGDLVPHWTFVDSMNYTEDDIVNIPGTAHLESLDHEFVNGEGYMDILIMGEPDVQGENSFLSTDFIEAKLNTKYGYVSDGYVKSELIDPPDPVYWENVVWDSSRAGKNAYVEMQVLDHKGNVLNGLKSRTSPLDISSLGDRDNITLKAVFHTEKLDITPVMYSWGVTWQKQNDRFKDSFVTDFRIDDTFGVDHVSEEFVISDDDGGWSFHGRDSKNHRNYEGMGLESKPGGYYWYTPDASVGGGLRSPVAYDGKVYVSSVDNRIYSFDIYTDEDDIGEEKSLSSADKSNNSYPVDSSIAVDDGFVVVATNKMGDANKIYGLNSDDLIDEIWDYPSKDSGSISFTSSPVIDDGKVFVTSWSGQFYDTTLTSMINILLNGNNQLIALDLNTGKPLWDPVTLPAGSFSSPAVSDGVVYAGCSNMFGSSLWAYDISTGEELWNSSVGVIGKASPVVVGDKVFVLSRNRTFSSSGVNRLVAVDKNTGSVLWNKTVSDGSANLVSNLYEQIVQLAPFTEMAVFGDTIFVLSPVGVLHAYSTVDGSEKWNYVGDQINGYLASPMIVGNRVCIISTLGLVEVLNVSYSGDVKPFWSYQMNIPEQYEIDVPAVVFASPIISNGVLFVSATDYIEDDISLNGRLYCFGRYTSNKIGTVTSHVINVPKGMWWNEFYGETTDLDGKNTTASFSILDENGKILLSGLNGTGNDISRAGSNKIRLKANLYRKNDTLDPSLQNWYVTWQAETNGPVFNQNSFEPSMEGWISTSKPTCSIEVKDQATGDLKSGLDISTAKYLLGYKTKDGKKLKWFSADTNNQNGAEKATLTADLSKDLKNVDIKNVYNITFYIEDLSGNSGQSNKTVFKMDITKPASSIDDTEDFSSTYNEPVPIIASASDSQSGIKHVELMYRYSEDKTSWNDWDTYMNPRQPAEYTWLFTPSKSGYYQLKTIATDEAENNEQKTNKEIEILYDDQNPELNTEFTDKLETNEIPSKNIRFSDDYKLKEISYRPNIDTNWTKIKTDIDSKEIEFKWKLDEKYWEQVEKLDTIYILFNVTDFCGNTYQTSEYDALQITKLPSKEEVEQETYLDLSEFKDTQWDEKYTIEVNIPDYVTPANVKLYYRYISEDGISEEFKQYGDELTETPFKWIFNAPDGQGNYEFYTVMEDINGETYKSETKQVEVSVFPMMALVFVILLIAAIFIIIGFVIYMMKKKKAKQQY